jgi:hypothetical protein
LIVPHDAVPLFDALDAEGSFRLELLLNERQGLLGCVDLCLEFAHLGLARSEGGREVFKEAVDASLSDEEVGDGLGGRGGGGGSGGGFGLRRCGLDVGAERGSRVEDV